jgi:hypothetical protein
MRNSGTVLEHYCMLATYSTDAARVRYLTASYNLCKMFLTQNHSIQSKSLYTTVGSSRPDTSHTSFRSRQKLRRANHTPLHVVCLGVNHMAQASSGAATCPAASAPAARSRAAPGPPRVLRPQLPLPGPEQLLGRHVCPGGPTVSVLLK